MKVKMKQFETTCNCCGKSFLITSGKSQYKYKTKDGYQCSYSCHNKELKKKGRYRVELGIVI